MCEEQSHNDLEERKLKIELDKLALERERFNLDRKASVITALSSVIPVIVIAATIAWGIISLKEQANSSLKLEAMKTVMATKTYGDAVSQATFLRENFPSELGKDFLSKLDIKNFPDAPNVSAKWNFMQYIAPRGLTPGQAQELYHLLYPLDDDWAYTNDVHRLLDQASKNKSN
jgi:hypothetical protein